MAVICNAVVTVAVMAVRGISGSNIREAVLISHRIRHQINEAINSSDEDINDGTSHDGVMGGAVME